jgi:hypothetical protein
MALVAVVFCSVGPDLVCFSHTYLPMTGSLFEVSRVLGTTGLRNEDTRTL